MNIDQLIQKRRTTRNFKEKEIEIDVLEELLNGARLAPSAANLQPIKYIIVKTPQMRDRIYENILWAKYIRPYGDPQKGHEPRAYIVFLVDKSIMQTGYEMLDIGLAVENIILSALDKDIGTCILGAFNKQKVMEILQIEKSEFELSIILALGYIDQDAVAVEVNKPNEIEYYINDDGILCVPKRKLEDVIISSV